MPYVGTYTFAQGALEATDNELTFTSADFTITQSAATLKALTYNGADQQLVTAGKTDGGRFVFLETYFTVSLIYIFVRKKIGMLIAEIIKIFKNLFSLDVYSKM